MIRAVIFDMDGLLIDSMHLWKEAVKRAVQSAGSKFQEDMWNASKGGRIDEIINYWYDQIPWSKKSIAEVQKEAEDNARALILERGRPMEGVEEVLEYVKSRNVMIGMASSSPQNIMDAVTEKLGIKEYFDLIYSAEHEEHGKPHPGVYITTAEKLGVPPYSCLVFEDSLVGLIAAKAARMKCVAVPSADYRNDPRMVLADVSVDSLASFGNAQWAEIDSI
jgi:sugar-phosphatase